MNLQTEATPPTTVGYFSPRPAGFVFLARRFNVGRWLIIFILALSARWGYALSFPANVQLQDVDARGYHALALNLLEGHGFSLNTDPPYVPDAIRTPAYPLFVAVIYAVSGRNPLHVALIQGVLDSFTAVILATLVMRLMRQP